MRDSVPILMYHQVTPRPPREFRRYAITPGRFAAHLTWLSLMGYRAIGLDELLEHRGGRRSLPRRAVVMTFDDGTEDCLEHVAPALSARGFTAIFYLVAGLVGQTSRWTQSETGMELALMDWGDVRDLQADGFQMGSHTMSHARLPTLAPAACREELSSSRRLLEDRLGHAVVHLAYPFGAFDVQVRGLAAETGYRSACSTRSGLSDPGDDPLALHRVKVYGHESLLDFACRLETGRSPKELMRLRFTHRLARLRSALARRR